EIPLAPFARDAFKVATFAKSLEGRIRQALGSPPLRDNRASILPEGCTQRFFCVDERTFLLQFQQAGVIDESGFYKKFLSGADRLDHGLNLPLEVMALIDHVGDVGRDSVLPFIEMNFVKYTE